MLICVYIYVYLFAEKCQLEHTDSSKITVFLKIEGFSVRNLSYCLPEMSLANKLLNSFPGIGGQKGNTFSSDSHNSYKRQLLVEGSS